MKKLEINGVDFELTAPRSHVAPFYGYVADEICIYNWYGRPSQRKVNIWLGWLRWARKTDGIECFKITSANVFRFTIGGLYVDSNGQEYNLVITEAHNRAIKVS